MFYMVDMQALPPHMPGPLGRLLVTVKSARRLKVADLTSSDPYVIVQLGDTQAFKTKVRASTLNPIWDEDFVFEVSAGRIPHYRHVG